RQRGLSESTIFQAWRIADRFLQFRFGGEIGEISRITANDIVAFMQEVCIALSLPACLRSPAAAHPDGRHL
ncbi:MAG TPA: hypothetical protein VF283_15780, partial [Bryobacteraceae bacterium]